MTDEHAQLVAELRALTETVLDRVEPLLRKAADPSRPEGHDPSDERVGSAAGEAPDSGSGCSWCPVCAVAALVRGEQHDLVTLVASQLSALIALLRQLLDEYWPRNEPEPDGPGPAEPESDESNGQAARFVPISVQIKP
ncbi:hypothetical protein [Rhodococcus sp. NPDC058521]|uniref:hypothetical protein n=1 Tax=Rhodococcus sp. NPDC058521 TaxID=3346536 RepID=UPI0036583CDD